MQISERSFSEYFSEDGPSNPNLIQCINLIRRTIRLIGLLMFTYYLAGWLTNGLRSENWGQLITAWAMILVSVLRIGGAIFLLYSFGANAVADFYKWRLNYPRVLVEPNSNYRPIGNQKPQLSLLRAGAQ